MTRTILISGLTILLLTACANSQSWIYPVSYNTDSNFLMFDHPFTNQASAAVLAQAEKLCAQRKQVAIQTSRTCSLAQCTTNYQCADKADVIEYGLGGK